MNAQILLLIPIVWIVYAWTKTMPQPQTKTQIRKQRKSRRKKQSKGYVPVVCPGDDDDFNVFSDDTDYFCEPSFEISEMPDDVVFSDDDDYLTDITYSYMIGNIYHHDD